MAACAKEIRQELRNLAIEDDSLLEATLVGSPPRGADLENVLLYNVGVPAAHVHGGVRIRRVAADEDAIVQRYRRVPLADLGDEAAGAMLATFSAKVADPRSVDSARAVWLTARRAVIGTLAAGDPAPGSAVDLRLRVVGPWRGSVDLIKKLLDGVCAAFHVYEGANIGEIVRRLAAELGEDPAELTGLLSSRRGAVLGPCDFMWLRGERVQVSPADDRIHAAEVTFAPGDPPLLVAELRALPAPDATETPA
jgi:hypothetical protein